MKRYASFKSLKKVSVPRSSPPAAQPQAEKKIIAFLQLVKESIQPKDKPSTKAHD